LYGPVGFRLPRLLPGARLVEWIPAQPGDPRGQRRLAAVVSRSRFAPLRRRAAADGSGGPPLGAGEGSARGPARGIPVRAGAADRRGRGAHPGVGTARALGARARGAPHVPSPPRPGGRPRPGGAGGRPPASAPAPAGPSLGLEISADGLRRLARVLGPEFAGDPLAYSEEPDPALRELFEFHEPNAAPALDAEPAAPPSAWWWPGPRAAHAADLPPPGTLAALVRRLDRWVPDNHELSEYRDAVDRLLDHVAAEARQRNALDARVAD